MAVVGGLMGVTFFFRSVKFNRRGIESVRQETRDVRRDANTDLNWLRQELHNDRNELKLEITQLRMDTKAGIRDLKKDLQEDMRSMEDRLMVAIKAARAASE